MPRISQEARVLVVDGSTVIRSRLTKTVSALDGVRLVGETGSLQEGVALARTHAPDLVILDIRLPDGYGIDSIHEFTRSEPAPAVAVLVSSSEFPYRKRCLERGADYCFDRTKELGQLEGMVAGLGWKRGHGTAWPQSGGAPPCEPGQTCSRGVI